MSIFDDVSASNSEDNNYPYHQYIKSPDAMGASSKGDLTSLGNDIGALTSYVGVLVSGRSSGQDISPLGNKYFMSTGATCTAADGTSQPRYVYINNVPDGEIPIISSAMGVNMTEFEGLVPGVLEDLAYINPLKLFTAFSEGTDCQEIDMEVRDISNNTTFESHYVLNDDIKDYNACWFTKRKNPVTNQPCVETMTVYGKKDPMLQLYTLCIGLLGIYIMFCLLKK